ncbi:MAG TPA: hypothetical protein VFP50_18500 [Anaeromyxobacteraceae bacterium]|nr:hypothetical protein [Anaeromyxobacteraceae bacterium]
MPRRTRLAPLALLAAAALGGCQDYNFSPVKYCLIQPGTERVTLSDISTADLLFVVDDSGSMGGKQAKLAQSFDAFIAALSKTNQDRVAANLEPIDFHIAITTTSVFLDLPTNAACSATCAGSPGSKVCCDTSTSQPLKVARTCSTLGSAAECSGGNTCRTDCLGQSGEKTCCPGAATFPEQVAQACSTLGDPCGNIQKRYGTTRVAQSCAPLASGQPDLTCPAGTTCNTSCPGMSGAKACCDLATGTPPLCDIGVGTVGGLYPRGDFVRKGSNPRVLHFTKDLFCVRNATDTGCLNSGPPGPAATATIQTLTDQFKQNVAVGTCGSGQEQPLEAARRAIKKALKQDGLSQPADVLPGEWPHQKSKLLVVYVGDEDDCSSPEDPNLGIIMNLSGTDACEADVNGRRFPVGEFADFLAGLGRPLATGVIASATGETCVDGACQAGLCCDTNCTGSAAVCTLGGLCGGQGAGFRMLELNKTLSGRGEDVVTGSVCDPGSAGSLGFSGTMSRVAEVVKQPNALVLPTQPASDRLILLRIIAPDGSTRKTCGDPAPAGTALADAQAGYDWWFTNPDPPPIPTGPSKYININRTAGRRNCEANPGETYSADYLGLVPALGCATDFDCVAALGGFQSQWHCEGPPATSKGTCICQ